jgi:hypothetical protein
MNRDTDTTRTRTRNILLSALLACTGVILMLPGRGVGRLSRVSA